MTSIAMGSLTKSCQKCDRSAPCLNGSLLCCIPRPQALSAALCVCCRTLVPRRTISVPAVHRLSGVCRENLCMLVPKKLRVTALGRGCHASSGAATSAKCLVYRANLKPGLERTGQPWESEFQIHQRLYRDALLAHLRVQVHPSLRAGPPAYRSQCPYCLHN